MRERERKAYICLHKDCKPPLRVFLLPGDEEPPRCPQHGTMTRQVNVGAAPTTTPAKAKRKGRK